MNLIKNLKINSVHLVGISLGGMVAFQVAEGEPNLVKSLVVVNALPEFFLKNFKQKWLFYSRIFLIKIFGLKIFAKILAKKLFPKQKNLSDEFVQNLSKNNPKIYLKILKSALGWSVVNSLSKTSYPILFIASQYDYTSLSQKKFFAEKIGTKLVEIKNSHHAVPAEKPQEFYEILSTFFEGEL